MVCSSRRVGGWGRAVEIDEEVCEEEIVKAQVPLPFRSRDGDREAFPFFLRYPCHELLEGCFFVASTDYSTFSYPSNILLV